jgi:outer membrane lipoprotein carrier protein
MRLELTEAAAPPRADLRYHSKAVELLAALALTGTLAAGAPAVVEPGDAEALARRVEEHHRRSPALTARFTQSYRSGALGREIVERGTVSIKQPDRMRWEYRDPERKTFVSDGTTFYFYVPADKQVVVREQADQRGIPALLLSGRGGLLQEFLPALERPIQGRARLRLTPRKPDPEIERLVLEIDQADRIRAVDILDAQGNRSRFAFDEIRENVSLDDDLFRFRIPPGVEVVTG